MRIIPRLLVCAVVILSIGRAQSHLPASGWTANAINEYRVIPNIVYSVASGYECRLDVYARRGTSGPIPTVMYIHGGGWVTGAKEGAVMGLLPYLELGFTVVNVEYRLTKIAPAPAAVEDCRLALRWIFKNAKEYGFDTTKIVVTGTSAGGHLALMTGMLQPQDGFDQPNDWDYATVQPKVAAIVNWFGIADVNDLLDGPDRQNYAVSWIGTGPDRAALARRVSPMNYVHAGQPPVFTVHGDNDPLVPYHQAVALHEALTHAGVPNQLLTIPGGKHGGFSAEEMQKVYAAIRAFLTANKIL